MSKILIVDDDIDILTLVKLTLTMKGFDVEALSKWEGIDKSIVTFSPDLILLDVSLNGADGREICKRLKSKTDTQHIPIVLFSANVEMEKSLGDCHAEAFVPKPYNLPYLLNTINTNIDIARAKNNSMN
jgi:DNA-binding response OmpR family regulator